MAPCFPAHRLRPLENPPQPRQLREPRQHKNLADGKRIHLLDINAKFMDAEGTLNKELLPDLLHLSPAAYEIWAEALAPKLNEIGVM